MLAEEKRYGTMAYHRCGSSGLKLPALSFGLWHNFGDTSPYENMKALCFTAFNNGITHFDLANNYGPQPGSAEENFGRILREELSAYRDELIISTKAGYTMWPGPYGDWGSRKYLLAQPRRQPQAAGSGICGYLLPPSPGSGNAAGGDHGGAGTGGAQR